MSPIEQMVFARMAETLFINEADFLELMKDWLFHPEYIDGELCGVVMTKGPEIHFVTAKMRQITRADLRKFMQPLIEQYGFAMTRAPKTDTRQARFNKLIGFEIVDQDEIDLIFKLTSLKGNKTCQQSQ